MGKPQTDRIRQDAAAPCWGGVALKRDSEHVAESPRFETANPARRNHPISKVMWKFKREFEASDSHPQRGRDKMYSILYKAPGGPDLGACNLFTHRHSGQT